MSPDVFAVLVGMFAAAVYIVCTRSMAARGGNAGRGGGSAGGGGRSAGSGRSSIPANTGASRPTGAGKSAGVPPAAGKASSGRTGKRSNWNADGTHGNNYDKGSKPTTGKATPPGSGKVTTVRGNVHGSNISVNDDGSSKVADAADAVTDLVSNTAAPGNDNDGNNMVGGDFGDVPVTGTTSVSFDTNGDIITDERAGGV